MYTCIFFKRKSRNSSRLLFFLMLCNLLFVKCDLERYYVYIYFIKEIPRKYNLEKVSKINMRTFVSNLQKNSVERAKSTFCIRHQRGDRQLQYNYTATI